MLKNNVISASQSPYSSPVLLVTKKDGSIRFCVDYRKLNSLTQKDAYNLPRIDDILDQIGGSRFRSTLDLTTGYWQIPMHPESKEKTAFTTRLGLYEFNVCPFGLTNAPPTFQRTMDIVLSGLSWDICLVYMDDIIVLSKTFEEHLVNLQAVFDRLFKYNLYVKLSKCKFCMRN